MPNQQSWIISNYLLLNADLLSFLQPVRRYYRYQICCHFDFTSSWYRFDFMVSSWRLRSWVGSNASCWEVWTWHESWAKNALWSTDGYGDLLSKSAVSLDVMREGFSAAKALPRQAGNGYDWLIGAVVIVTKLSYVVVWCMDYVSDDHSITPYSGHIHWTVLLPFHRQMTCQLQWW